MERKGAVSSCVCRADVVRPCRCVLSMQINPLWSPGPFSGTNEPMHHRCLVLIGCWRLAIHAELLVVRLYEEQCLLVRVHSGASPPWASLPAPYANGFGGEICKLRRRSVRPHTRGEQLSSAAQSSQLAITEKCLSLPSRAIRSLHPTDNPNSRPEAQLSDDRKHVWTRGR